MKTMTFTSKTEKRGKALSKVNIRCLENIMCFTIIVCITYAGGWSHTYVYFRGIMQ